MDISNVLQIKNSDVKKEKCYRHQLDFMHYCWIKDKENDPLIIGYHTKEICKQIDIAIDDFENGISTFLITKVPFRHGKSDIISRYLPARFMGLFPDLEIMITSYSHDLSQDFSRDTQRIIQSENWYSLFEHEISKKISAMDRWGLEDQIGILHATGLGGSLTGRGYHLGICDDYLKNREESESQRIRDKTWNGFKDFLTRKAPVSITIILATPWHVDDVIGRIENRMNPKHEKYNIDFPKFKVIKFPAENNDAIKYESGYLFPERFSKLWYTINKATLGEYGYKAQMQCDPFSKGGNIFKVNNIKTITKDDIPKKLRFIRAWDLASSEKERTSDDPDWTVGSLMAIETIDLSPKFVRDKLKMKEILKQFDGRIDLCLRKVYLKDVIRFREEAGKRNQIIIETAMKDGSDVRIAIESVGAYKDAYVQIRDLLRGLRIVYKITSSTDKVVRASPMEVVIESGNFHIIKDTWNDIFIDEFRKFPSGSHDDIVDSISTGWFCETKIAVLK